MFLLPQARQTFAQRKTWKPASHQTKPMKNVVGTRMRKSRTPASFVPKPLRNCSLKNPETLLLESTKKTFGTHKKQCFGNRCRQPSRKACARCLWRSGFRQAHTAKEVPWRGAIVKLPHRSTTIRNRAEAMREPQQVLCPSHCETAAGKIPKRRFWNPLKTKK